MYYHDYLLDLAAAIIQDRRDKAEPRRPGRRNSGRADRSGPSAPDNLGRYPARTSTSPRQADSAPQDRWATTTVEVTQTSATRGEINSSRQANTAGFEPRTFRQQVFLYVRTLQGA
jgi:hypothetical protein